MSEQSSSPTPNKYGRIAHEHWETYNPSRYAEIPDPEVFFSTWGDQLEDQIGDLAQQIEWSLTPETGYLERVGQLNMAKLRAEESVMQEQVYSQRERDYGPQDEAIEAEMEAPTAMAAAMRRHQEIEDEDRMEQQMLSDPYWHAGRSTG